MPTAHAALGASSASRWITCPGSVAMSEGREDRPSAYAMYGTAAHTLAERHLTAGTDPLLGCAPSDLGAEIDGVTVDAEMIEIVDTYLATIGALLAGEVHVDKWVEMRVSLDALSPPVEMFGTADFVAVLYRTRTLLVVDLKTGAGVHVPAAGNLQMRYYALGAYFSLGPVARAAVDTVKMVIVQPRAGGVSVDEMDVTDLVPLGADLLAAAHAAMSPGAPLRPGSHCRFCRASGACPAQANFALASAQAVFSDDPLPDLAAGPTHPSFLTNEEMGMMLDRLAAIDTWRTALADEAMRRLTEGQPVPGWKLVAKRARRRWLDEDTAVATLSSHVDIDALLPRALVSPAQAERLLPRTHRNLVGQLAVSESSGPTLATERDPRPALSGAVVFNDGMLLEGGASD